MEVRLAPLQARNNSVMPDSVVTVAEVKAFKTQSGNTRFVLRDGEGREYTTFREQIARDAVAAEGRRARITFHEQQRGNFWNVYLDAVEPLDQPTEDGSPEAVEEVACKTAVDAARWLLGGEPEEAVPPEELFERLQPFKERVADDIRGDPADSDDERLQLDASQWPRSAVERPQRENASAADESPPSHSSKPMP